VSAEVEKNHDTRDTDQQALEEIRRLFARYRRIARHGVVTERDDEAEPQADAPDDASAVNPR
jgi:hypothetical protein